MKLQLQLLLIGSLALSSCSSVASDSYWRNVQSDLGIQVGNPAIAESEPPQSPYPQELQAYSQGATISQEAANLLLSGWYAPGQSQGAIRNLLGGYPRWVEQDRDVFAIAGTDDGGIKNPATLTVVYELDPFTNTAKATSWYGSWGTQPR